MTGILDRWRQLGRRYFWPHLLFGMVAAGLGLPAFSASAQTPTTPETSASRIDTVPACLQSLAYLPGNHRRASFTVDYWHQHAIRTVIRHLSFAVAQPEIQDTAPLRAQQDVLLDKLSALLTLERKPPVVIDTLHHVSAPQKSAFTIAAWLGQVQGIRAGPQHLS